MKGEEGGKEEEEVEMEIRDLLMRKVFWGSQW